MLSLPFFIFWTVVTITTCIFTVASSRLLVDGRGSLQQTTAEKEDDDTTVIDATTADLTDDTKFILPDENTLMSASMNSAMRGVYNNSATTARFANLDIFANASTALQTKTCRNQSVPCIDDRTCALLCNDHLLTPTMCRGNLCVLKSEIGGDNGGGVDGGVVGDEEPAGTNCNTRIGEFAVLQALPDITGSALWRCVNLYSVYADRSTFCEGGTWNMDARVRAPSYSDCVCGQNHTRVVYEFPGLATDGRPHCIATSDLPYYSSSYRIV